MQFFCPQNLFAFLFNIWTGMKGSKYTAIGPILARLGPARHEMVPNGRGFFYFFIFYFCFLQKIYFRFGKLQKYTPAARLPGGQDLAARLPGGRGLSAKKKTIKNCRQVPGDWPPGSGAAGPHPYIRCWLPPTPSFALLKIQKKEKRRREGVRERQSGEALSNFQAGDFS